MIKDMALYFLLCTFYFTLCTMKTNTSTIHLVRHGAVYNPNRIYYGRMPLFGLSDEGKQHAQFGHGSS